MMTMANFAEFAEFLLNFWVFFDVEMVSANQNILQIYYMTCKTNIS